MSSHPLSRRRPNSEVLTQGQHFERLHPLTAVVDAVPTLVLIVNDCRQVVYANQQASKMLGVASYHELLGKRPGELLRCEHASEGHDGCGTSEACSMCGAARAIRAAEEGLPSINECRIRQQANGTAMDFRVSTTPLKLNGKTFSVVSLTDVSHENRRAALERIFFHDLLNTLGALSGYAQLLDGAPPEDRQELTEALLRLTETMAEEVRAQRDLAAAENNDLAVRVEAINARELIEQVAVLYRNQSVSRGRSVTIGSPADPIGIHSDRRLMQRVLANMVKNACEASLPGGTVTLRCYASPRSTITFEVHNDGFMPKDVQLQIFHRSFSTRGPGRGLGTYSMKLLGERYLRGNVRFTSTPEAGTTFSLTVPHSL